MLELLLKKLDTWAGDDHAKVREFAKAMIAAIKRRFPEDQCLPLMVMNHFNPKFCRNFPSWIYGDCSP